MTAQQEQDTMKKEGPFSKGNTRLINLLNQVDGGRVGSLTLQNSYNALGILRREAQRQNIKLSHAFVFISNPKVIERLPSVEEELDSSMEALFELQEGTKEAAQAFESEVRKYSDLARRYESLEAREYELDLELYGLQGGIQPTPPMHKLTQIDLSAASGGERPKKQPYRAKSYEKIEKSSFEIEATKLFSGLDHNDPEDAKTNLKKLLELLEANSQLTKASGTSLAQYFVLCRDDEGRTFEPVKKFDDLEDELDTVTHEFDDLMEQYQDIGTKTILYAEHNDRLSNHIDGTLKHIEFLEKRIKEEKQQRARTATTVPPQSTSGIPSGPTVIPRSTPQPTPQPPPVQPTPQPQPRPTRIVTPPPRQPVTPPPIQPQPVTGPTTTVQPPSINCRSWPWSLPKPVGAIALSCLLIFGGGYVAKKTTGFDAFSSSSWGALFSGGKIPAPTDKFGTVSEGTGSHKPDTKPAPQEKPLPSPPLPPPEITEQTKTALLTRDLKSVLVTFGFGGTIENLPKGMKVKVIKFHKNASVEIRVPLEKNKNSTYSNCYVQKSDLTPAEEDPTYPKKSPGKQSPPKKTVSSNPSLQSTSQQTHREIFYVSYDPISLWSGTGEGKKRLETLSFGEKLQVDLPLGQDDLNQSDAWAFVHLPDGRTGYVLGKQISKTEPVRNPEVQPEQVSPSERRGTETKAPEQGTSGKPTRFHVAQAVVCRNDVKVWKSMVNPTSSPVVATLKAGTPVEVCGNYRPTNGGRDTLVSICSLSDRGGMFEEDKQWSEIGVPSRPGVEGFVRRSDLSLNGTECRQSITIKGNSWEPK